MNIMMKNKNYNQLFFIFTNYYKLLHLTLILFGLIHINDNIL
jgi:hypothetical protein